MHKPKVSCLRPSRRSPYYRLRWRNSEGRIQEKSTRTKDPVIAFRMVDQLRSDLSLFAAHPVLELPPSQGCKGRVRDSTPGIVYALLAPEIERVKIGWASDIFGRLKKISGMMPVDTAPVAFCLGPRQREAEFHSLLRDYNIRGEWFAYTLAVQEVIAANMEPAGHDWKEKAAEFKSRLA